MLTAKFVDRSKPPAAFARGYGVPKEGGTPNT
jgi:hypothetical protein